MRFFFSSLLITLLLVWQAQAVTIPVTSGSVVLDLDPVALGSLNYGTDPNIPALILEEFFRGDEDRNRTYDQILSTHIVPNFTAIPTQCLKCEINGTSVTNLTDPRPGPQRNRVPSTFTYDPANVTGTATGVIGLTGITRYIGDFTGAFVLGDFDIRYNLSATEYPFPNRGWVFVNNYAFIGVPAFETANVAVTASGGKLVIEGDLTMSYELDLYFFPGDWGKKIGTFRLETPTAAVTAPRTVSAARISGGSVQLGVSGKGNMCYQLQYSTDLLNWNSVGTKVTGREQLIQWTDNGPPLTPTPPSSSTQRFYRLIED
ncbi:MAG: hypothetical protein U1F81_12410 [Verrucomicrobiaceae bacterium]